MKHRLKSVAALGFVTLLFGQAMSHAAPPTYRVTDLGVLPGEATSEALALNDQGQVVCVCSTGGQGKAFLWDRGIRHPLPRLSGFSPLSLWPRAINNQGQIAGTAFGPNLDTRRAFLAEGNKVQDLGTPPGEYTEAYGINDKGQVVGSSYTYIINSKGERQNFALFYTFLWSKTAGFRRLSSSSDGSLRLVYAVNNASQVIGAPWPQASSQEGVELLKLPPDERTQSRIPSAGFLWQNGQTQNLSPPPCWTSRAVALNNRGDVLGTSSLYPAPVDGPSQVVPSAAELFGLRHSHHIVLWKNGRAEDLGEMGTEPEVTATALNNADDIVGYVRLADNSGFRAFLWQNGKRFLLTDLISPTSGWVLEEAQSLNNRGQIIGNGTHNGQRHAFLLTPQ